MRMLSELLEFKKCIYNEADHYELLYSQPNTQILSNYHNKSKKVLSDYSDYREKNIRYCYNYDCRLYSLSILGYKNK
jgi:hypothetical protein